MGFSRVRRVALAIAVTFPSTVAAQTRQPGSLWMDGRRIYVKVYVTLSDATDPYNPIARLPVIFYRGPGDSVVLTTDFAGQANAALDPGDYRVVTPYAALAHGIGYSWDLPITVRFGMDAVDLTARNATSASGGARPAVVAAGPIARPLAPQAVPPVQSAFTPKDGGVAFLLSFLITGAGQMYAGEPGKGVVLLLTNLAGAGLAINGASQCASSADNCPNGETIAGVGIVLFSWIYSMADAPAAAGRYNREHSRIALAGLAPVLDVAPHGSPVAGVRLALTFRE